MKFNKVLIIFSFIILFTFGFSLGIMKDQDMEWKEQENEDLLNSESISSESINAESTNDDRLIRDNLNQDLPPDEIYYEKAKVLQKEFPDTFIMNCHTTEKRIALTFDDGPDDKTTPKILDILNQYKVKATFFVVGQNIQRFSQVVERIVDEGHQVANHSWSHIRPTDLTDDLFESEVTLAKKALQDHADSSDVFYYRPPYGLLTHDQISWIRNKGALVISWSIDSLDWTGADAKQIRNKVVDSVHPGAIILMHSAGGKDNRSNTVIALPEIIKNLTEQGYEFTTVEELLRDN